MLRVASVFCGLVFWSVILYLSAVLFGSSSHWRSVSSKVTTTIFCKIIVCIVVLVMLVKPQSSPVSYANISSFTVNIQCWVSLTSNQQSDLILLVSPVAVQIDYLLDIIDQRFAFVTFRQAFSMPWLPDNVISFFFFGLSKVTCLLSVIKTFITYAITDS